MALVDFVVNKRNGRRQHKRMGALGKVETDSWSSLPFAGEEQDTEAGAEEGAGVLDIARATCRFSCRLVTLM